MYNHILESFMETLFRLAQKSENISDNIYHNAGKFGETPAVTYEVVVDFGLSRKFTAR